MDEQLRRYYLDQLGIQCWQSATEQVAGPVDEVVDTGSLSTAAASPAPSLEQAVLGCTACSLHRHREQALPGRGDADAEVLVLLPHPSVEDDRAGSLCGGEQGALLEKMLAAIGLSFGQVYITSLLKCAVPARHTIMPVEIDQCRAHLDAQISTIRPGHILVLGELTARCLFQQDRTLDDFRRDINGGRDVVMGVYKDIRLLASYSPQELLERPACKRKAWQDLQLLQARLANA